MLRSMLVAAAVAVGIVVAMPVALSGSYSAADAQIMQKKKKKKQQTTGDPRKHKR